jgi:hypothetical protein
MRRSPRTKIDDLSLSGHELSDERLRLAVGGRMVLTKVGPTGTNKEDYVDDPPPTIG